MDRKLNLLKHILKSMQSVCLAYSGGVDSTLLLKISKDILGEKILAVTARSELIPQNELDFANKMARRLNVKHLFIRTKPLSIPEFVRNSRMRCYYCKRRLFLQLERMAKKFRLNHIIDGTNRDDLKEFRAGNKAARELGVRSPLKEAGFNKEDIRRLSKSFKLITYDRASSSCLATRIPYGERITKEDLKTIEKAEEILKSLGLRQLRLRHYGDLARIEVEKKDILRLIKLSEQFIDKLKRLGYAHVTLDLGSYRSSGFK